MDDGKPADLNQMPGVYRIEDSDGTKQAGMDNALAAQITFDGKIGGKTIAGDFRPC
jgi:hypothetical protein